MGTKIYLYQIFKFWLGTLFMNNISYFPKILSLKLFGNSWGNSRLPFYLC